MCCCGRPTLSCRHSSLSWKACTRNVLLAAVAAFASETLPLSCPERSLASKTLADLGKSPSGHDAAALLQSIGWWQPHLQLNLLAAGISGQFDEALEVGCTALVAIAVGGRSSRGYGQVMFMFYDYNSAAAVDRHWQQPISFCTNSLAPLLCPSCLSLPPQADAQQLLSSPPPDPDAAARLDFTTTHSVFTIDDASTTDIDDGISLERLPDGGLRLWVHIADPSRWVAPGTPLAAEAQRRTKTLYLPTGNVPMFPKSLAEGPFRWVGVLCAVCCSKQAHLARSSPLASCRLHKFAHLVLRLLLRSPPHSLLPCLQPAGGPAHRGDVGGCMPGPRRRPAGGQRAGRAQHHHPCPPPHIR